MKQCEISRYVQRLLFTSFTTEVTLGQCKNSQMAFPHPGLKHWQAGANTAAILTLVLSCLVELTVLTQQFQ